MKRLIEYLQKQSRAYQVSLGISLLLVIGLTDYLTGPQLSFSIFYLIPISLFAWFVRSSSGVAMSFASAAMWLAADLLWGAPYSQPWIPYWNALVRLGLFLAVALLLAALRKLHDHQEDIVKERTAALQKELEVHSSAEQALRQAEVRFQSLLQSFSLSLSTANLTSDHKPYSTAALISDLAKEINQVTKNMELSVQNMLNFSSFASHELRTPLAVMRNQLEEALNTETTQDALRPLLTSIYDEILSVSRIIDDLMNISTFHVGKFKLEPKQVAFHTFMKDFYDEALFLSREKNISVVLGPCPEIWLDIDVHRMRQVFFNLLDNALTHTPNNGRIRIGYQVNKHQVVVYFADTGEGIPQEELPRIFEPFYRSATTSTKSRGAGLGLPLVKLIVEAHQGSVTVESTVGKGTVFTITLPVTSDAFENLSFRH